MTHSSLELRWIRSNDRTSQGHVTLNEGQRSVVDPPWSQTDPRLVHGSSYLLYFTAESDYTLVSLVSDSTFFVSWQLSGWQRRTAKDKLNVMMMATLNDKHNGNLPHNSP